MSTVSSLSGLYNNPNIVSGLVSGLDTESMIESLVESYGLKINGFQQQSTMVGWQQDLFRGIISDLNTFANKYTSYTNPTTNLSSNSFYTSAVSYLSQGEYADKITTSGTTDSIVTVDRVISTATAARAESTALTPSGNEGSITGESVNLSSASQVSNLSGNMTFNYGNDTITIEFDSNDIIDVPEDATAQEKAQALADVINSKLADASITIGSTSYNGDQCIQATVTDSGEILLEHSTADNAVSGGNSVSLKSAGSDIQDALGIVIGEKDEDGNTIPVTSLTITDDTELTKNEDITDQMSGKDLTFNYNGSSRTVTLPKIESDGNGGYYINGSEESSTLEEVNEAIIDTINSELSKCYGYNVITVENVAETAGELQLSFNMENDDDGTSSTLSIVSTAGSALGLGSTATNYLNTSDSLGDVLGDVFETATLVDIEAIGDVTTNFDTGVSTDSMGNTVEKSDDGVWYRVDDDGEVVQGLSLVINDVEVGVFAADESLVSVLNRINSSDCGVSASYSTMTGKFVLTATQTGSNSTIEVGGDLGEAIFGSEDDGTLAVTNGTDAVAVVTVNGSELVLTRSENVINIDGLSVTLKGTFNNEDSEGNVITSAAEYNAANEAGELSEVESVSFEKTTDSSKIVDAIVEMVNDYNELMSTLRSMLTTTTATDSSGSDLLPYTDDEAEGLSSTELAAREEEIKAGLLFGDSTIRALYESMGSMFSNATNGIELSAMGITSEFSFTDYSSSIVVDTDKLTAMIESDLDRVKNVFASTTSDGASINGLMADFTTQINNYANTSSGSPGILVQKAGTELSSLSLLSNTMQTKIDNYTSLIETWQEKLVTKVNYFQAQFTQLEVLMANMNSQSSALSGLSTSSS